MMNNKLPKEQETFNEETISALNEVDECVSIRNSIRPIHLLTRCLILY